MTEERKGIWSAIAAYGLWGVLPVYWKLLQAVPAGQILAHRIVWSFVVLAVLVGLKGEGAAFRAACRSTRTVLVYLAAAGLLATNWFLYIWSVNTGRIVETSLGYYINPLVSMLLGVTLLRERLRRAQWFAFALALSGVVYLTLQYGSLPWIALVLACSFGLYGLLKKTAPLSALHGLVLETAALALPAALYLGWEQHNGSGAFGRAGLLATGLLVFSGAVTSLPLLLFARAARQVKLSTMGILQYLSPTCALAIGIGIYHEPFPRARLVGFGLVWAALAIYWWDSRWARGGR